MMHDRRLAELAVAGTALADLSARPLEDSLWQTQASLALSDLEEVLRHHIADMESPDGVLAEIGWHVPSLWGRVQIARAQHRSLGESIMKIDDGLRDNAPASAIARMVTNLLVDLEHHRSLVAGLVLICESFNRH